MTKKISKSNNIEFEDLLDLIAANIKAHRLEQNISQAELARRAELSIQTVNEIETRKSPDIRLLTLFALAKVLNLSVSRLFAQSDIDVTTRDHAELLKASEAIVRITKKLKKRK